MPMADVTDELNETFSKGCNSFNSACLHSSALRYSRCTLKLEDNSLLHLQRAPKVRTRRVVPIKPARKRLEFPMEEVRMNPTNSKPKDI